MQKSCKNEGCQRKFDKTSHSDFCPPCSGAYRSGETHTHKRVEQQQRQQAARTQQQQANRNISNPQDFPQPGPSPTQPLVSQPAAPTNPIPVPTTQAAPPTHQSVPANNVANFPRIGQQQPRSLPNIDVNQLFDTFTSMADGSESVNPNTAMRDMYGMMLHMFSQSSENEQSRATVTQCVNRLDALEAKVGNPDEVAIPLSIAVRNMPLPSPGTTDIQLVQSAFREIRAQGVDVERDIIRVNRLGDTSNGRLGTILVEMRNQEVKAQIMKTKKCLENHHSEGLRKLILKNAQTKSEIKTNIALNEMLKRIPGQENNFVAGNGHIMSKNQTQRHHFNPHNNTPTNPAPRFPNLRMLLLGFSSNHNPSIPHRPLTSHKIPPLPNKDPLLQRASISPKSPLSS